MLSGFKFKSLLAVVLLLIFTACIGTFPAFSKTAEKVSKDSKIIATPPLVPDSKKGERLLTGSNVGYRVVKSAHSPAVAYWYPTTEKEENFSYILGENPVTSKLALDGTVSAGKFPLVFYVHGASGSGLSSFFLCEALARNGYVVVAPDFSDQAFASRIDRPVVDSKENLKNIWAFINSLVESGLNKEAASGRKKYAYRPKQLLAAIKSTIAMDSEKESFLFNHLETDKIGLVGHSMGAWTALLVAGAAPKYRSPVPVAATVALSGPSNPFVFKVASKNDLALIKSPLLFQYGENEKLFPDRQDRRYNYERASSSRPRVLACIANCNHFDFSCGSGKSFGIASDYIRKSGQRLCLTELTLDFLNLFMGNRPEGQKIPRALLVKSPGIVRLDSNLSEVLKTGENR